MAVWHTFRCDGFGGTKSKKLTPTEAIKWFCKECYGYCTNVTKEIEECPSEICPLYPFRLGRNPKQRREPPETLPRSDLSENMSTSRLGEGVDKG